MEIWFLVFFVVTFLSKILVNGMKVGAWFFTQAMRRSTDLRDKANHSLSEEGFREAFSISFLYDGFFFFYYYNVSRSFFATKSRANFKILRERYVVLDGRKGKKEGGKSRAKCWNKRVKAMEWNEEIKRTATNDPSQGIIHGGRKEINVSFR